MEKLNFRNATLEDVDIYFSWINDVEVRKRSFNSDVIDYSKHVEWFSEKVKDRDTILLLYFQDLEPVGQVRIELKNCGVISFSIDSRFRGQGLASKMLESSAVHFFKLKSNFDLIGYVKKCNIPSVRAFERAGFIKEELEDKILYRLRGI